MYYDDAIAAGAYGDWRSDTKEIWRIDVGRDLKPSERYRIDKRLEAIRRQLSAQRESEQKAASTKAESILRALRQANPNHPYLLRKSIRPHSAHMDGHGNIVIPIFNGGNITSIQFITPSGKKRFLSGGKVAGGYFRIGEITATILICEGFAMGATIHQESRHCVYVAFNSGNLTTVAKAVRRFHRQAEIIIAGDNDHATDSNPGKAAAINAARAIGAKWVIPDFDGLNAATSDTDFNDLARLSKMKEIV